LKDFAARSFLLKLEAKGWVELPELQVHQRRSMRRVPESPEWDQPPVWTGSLAEMGPVGLTPVEAGSPSVKRWRFYLDRYHYLGCRVVGENLGYLATDRQGRDVGCLLFGAAWQCAPRDRKLGWSAVVKAEPAFSLVIRMDGWMARERGVDWGVGPRRKDPQRVEWREIKSAVIYRLEQRAENVAGRGLLLQKYAVATPPETSPVDFGAAVQAEAQEWLNGMLHGLRHGGETRVVRRLEYL
jgi:hypothetical protein